MREHKLTVSGLYRPGWHAFPEDERLPLLQLVGRWLWEAGFGVGTRVRVDVVGEGRLVVTRVEEGEEARQLEPVVWIEAGRIGCTEESRPVVLEEVAG